LAGIIASAEACRTWLSGDKPNVERARTAIERIIRDGGAAADIIQRIRALFKQTAPAMSPLHINEVIDEVRRLIQDELDRKGIFSEFDLAQTLPQVLADRIQIQQVLVNLIRNGSEALENVDDQAKRLIVRSRFTDANIVVEVCDYGSGLQGRHLSHFTARNKMAWASVLQSAARLFGLTAENFGHGTTNLREQCFPLPCR
jgi:C4-dicarboxylate-specific signal transduction histidine kinase